ncbi:MAG TPA: homoserine dehydrogenase [Acidobacteriaceae bacterium]|jgi:homoserine dehydrogenase|nr:homoserine dehydrogenase [Acidobacteriaceae bacterium]
METRAEITKDVSRRLRVAIAGFGTVGSAVARILIEQSGGTSSFELTYILNRQIDRKRVEWVPKSVRWTEDIDEVLDSDIDVLVELVGGLDPAGTWVRRALASGKSVVTANKALIAAEGVALSELACRHRQHLAYGASVAGGVPVLSGLQEGLAGDELVRVSGILNGTCNYILTRMEQAGLSFADALLEAQRAGFAEADPSADVDGYDARAKITILSRVALGADVDLETVLCRSIRPITAVDLRYAAELGCTIRQISHAEVQRDALHIAVQPMLVERALPHARVVGAQNIVVSTGRYGGETTFSGNGAGGNPTAVAVVSDLVALARLGTTSSESMSPALKKMLASSQFVMPHYTRYLVRDRPGILAAISQVLATYAINVDAVLQLPGHSREALPFAITLEPCSQQALDAALDEIGKLHFLAQPPLCLPILRKRA